MEIVNILMEGNVTEMCKFDFDVGIPTLFWRNTTHPPLSLRHQIQMRDATVQEWEKKNKQ